MTPWSRLTDFVKINIKLCGIFIARQFISMAAIQIYKKNLFQTFKNNYLFPLMSLYLAFASAAWVRRVSKVFPVGVLFLQILAVVAHGTALAGDELRVKAVEHTRHWVALNGAALPAETRLAAALALNPQLAHVEELLIPKAAWSRRHARRTAVVRQLRSPLGRAPKRGTLNVRADFPTILKNKRCF